MSKKSLMKMLGYVMCMVLTVLTGGMYMLAGGGAALDGDGVGVDGDASVTNLEPEADDNFYLKAVDEKITKIRPASTPLDTISRHVAKKTAVKAMEVKYYAVGTRPFVTKLKTAIGTNQSSGTSQVIVPYDSSMFSIADTIRVKDVKGYKEDGSTQSSQDLMLYVTGKNDAGNPVVVAINGLRDSAGGNTWVPKITAETNLCRMGKACSEKAAQAPVYSILPRAKSNYCQKFMAQVEQSTIDQMSAKEVNWDFSDQEESTLFDMKTGMEYSFLFGAMSKFNSPVDGDLVWTTQGIYWEAGKDLSLTKDSSGDITDKQLVDFSKALFTGVGAGSKKKILFAGSTLLAALEKATSDKYQFQQSIEMWGMEFKGWKTNFGTILVIHAEAFDMYGMSDCGFVLDPGFLEKKTFEAFGRTQLDLKKSGQRDSEAVVLREISCLCLKSPQSHARVKLA